MIAKTKLTCAAGIALLLPAVALGQSDSFKITDLTPDQAVDIRELVSGEAPIGVKVWLIVHPLEIDDCWAQGPSAVSSGGTWRIMGQFGEAGQHSGKPYEIRAIANPHVAPEAPLKAGLVSCGIEGDLNSDSVDLVRR